MKIFFQTLRRHNQKIAVFFVAYAVLALVASVAGILVSRLTGEISQAALEFDADVILRFLGTMAIITAVQAAAAGASAYISGRKAGSISHALRKSFARHFLSIGFKDLDGKNSGGLLSNYTNDLPGAASLLSASTIELISGAISVLAALVFMVDINPLQTLIFFVMFPLLVVLQAKISAPLQQKAMEMSDAREQFNAVVSDSLQNTAIVVAYSLESAMENRYLACYDKYYRVRMSFIRSYTVLIISGVLATLLPILYVNAAAGVAVANGSMSISQFIAFTSVAGIAGNWLSMLSQNLNGLRADMAGAEKINDAMSDTPEDITAGFGSFPGGDTAVRLENVTFTYPGGTLALDGVTLDIKAGEKVALVGGSGSGKSTVLKLLLALYTPDAGEIYISGALASHISRQALRSHLAYVPQDSFLFPESIRENIASGRLASEEKLVEACRGAEILDFVNSLPRGFDTVLTESADNVSGGQRQRLAIARALLQDPPVILLDEATSALDPTTEKAVLGKFKTLLRDKTVILVAHRLSAIEACDRIILMDGGKVAGTGTHQQLLANSLPYRVLYESFARQEEGVSI